MKETKIMRRRKRSRVETHGEKEVKENKKDLDERVMMGRKAVCIR